MAVKKPLVNYGGKIKELDSGDTISGGGGSITTIAGTEVINFGEEQNCVVVTIASALITETNFKSFSYIPQETVETTLTDFTLNGVSFNIENIIDNTSFDIRATALNDASGNYTIKYTIIL